MHVFPHEVNQIVMIAHLESLKCNHMVRSQEPETSIRARSLAFYRDALAHYVETAKASLSLTIDRSFSRLPQD